jgi:hypothetical protein
LGPSASVSTIARAAARNTSMLTVRGAKPGPGQTSPGRKNPE